MVTLHSLLAVGPLPPSVAPDATGLLDLIVDLQSDILWDSGVYASVNASNRAPETGIAA